MNWPVKSLGSLLSGAELFLDGDWVESKDQDPYGSIRLLQLADIGDGYFIDKSHRFINEEAFSRLKCTELREGDILVARMPDPLGRACILGELSQRCITVVDVCIIRVDKNKVNPKWLVHAINSPLLRQQIQNLAKGATRVRISRKNLAEVKLQVPPLEEQQRIADQLDAADRILRLREASIAKLDQLAQSVFVEMFGADKSNNKNWSRAKLGSLCDIEWGNTSITKASYIDNGIPAFSASGQDGFLAEAEHNGKGIVLSAIGARCGKCFKASGEWTAIKNTITIKSKSDQIDIDFLYQILNDEKSWDVRGAGQPFITLATARSREIIVPPIQLQIRFADFINELVHRRTEFEVSGRHLLALNRSLQNKSFSVN